MTEVAEALDLDRLRRIFDNSVIFVDFENGTTWKMIATKWDHTLEAGKFSVSVVDPETEEENFLGTFAVCEIMPGKSINILSESVVHSTSRVMSFEVFTDNRD